MKKKILYVEWIDSAGTNGWLTKEEVDSIGDIAKCCSAGFLVKETKTALVLALNGSQDGLSSPYGDIISIPLVCITKREEL